METLRVRESHCSIRHLHIQQLLPQSKEGAFRFSALNH